MTGIHALVFSKNRAMQLDAFLSSAHLRSNYKTITVLEHSDDNHLNSYDIARDEHQWVIWDVDDSAKDFQERVGIFLESHERIVFHTDDDIFFRKAWLPPEHWQAVHSMRLGLNTTYCHPLDVQQQLPEPPLETQMLWKWRDAEYDFGYPLSLNATIYNSADILPLLNFTFKNPTELEAGLDARRNEFKPEWMTSPLHSCCVSLPHNVTSESSNNPRGNNPEWQPDRLRDLYLDGWRIDLDAMDFSNIVGAHQEVPLKFYRP